MLKKKFPSIAKLTLAVNNFKNKDCSSTEIEEFYKLFCSLATNFSFPTFIVPATIKLHRIRINDGNEDWKRLSDLWCPEVKKVKKLGRANDIGDQILYMSGGADTCLREMNPAIGSIITVLECEVTQKIQAIEVGVLNKIQSEEYLKQFAHIHKVAIQKSYNNDKQLIHLDSYLKKFMASEFSRTVGLGDEHLYKKTIAIAKFFFECSAVEAILYPSTRSDCKTINYAIPLKFANEKLKPVRVDVFEVVKSDKHPLVLKLIKGSYSSLDFENDIKYTDAQPIIGWANKLDAI